jgi:outer membrane protein OmpA-like peptidoglycan-associated protein
MQIKKRTTYTKLLKAIMLCFVVFGSFFLSAQTKGKNLVPNPSFEEHKNKANDIKNATPWKGVGTVDYYMKVEKIDTSEYKGAHKGNCYAGLRFQEEYKEYMYVQLLEPLEKDRTYFFRMYVRLLSSSTVTVRQLGVYFSPEPFKYGMTFDEAGLIDTTYQKGISGKNWLPIQGNYVSHGGEKYIIIGNFSANMKADFVKQNKWDLFSFKEAYYFIDDVSLRKKLIASDTVKTPVPTVKAPVKKPKIERIYPDNLTTGQTIIVKNIYFESGTAKLKVTSEKGLNQLEGLLNNHPFMEVQFNGYTDNTGNSSTNIKLSKERAKAVYEYLKKDGITNPMTYKGFGEIKPIAPNDTDENRAKNRRIECVIIKQ